MTFAQKFQELRESKGFTIPLLSSATGLPQSTVKSYLMGYRDPSAENLFKMADALGVSIEEFRGCTANVKGKPKKKK